MKRFIFLLGCFFALVAHAQPVAGGGPEIVAWISGADQATIAAGEPLRIGVKIALPSEKTRPLTLVGDGADWRNAIKVELMSGAGGTTLVAQPAGTPIENSLTVTSDEPAQSTWWISSRALAALVAGDYQVRVRLTQSALTADPITVTLSGKSLPDGSLDSLLAKAHEDVLEGQPEAAAKRIDTILARDASNLSLLVFRAQLSLSVGDARSARACLVRARRLAALEREGEPSLPVDELFRRLDLPPHLDPAPTTPPPTWSRPPALVFAPVSDNPAGATPAARLAPSTEVTSRANSAAPSVATASSMTTMATPPAPAAAIAPATITPEAIPDNLPGKIVPTNELADLKVIADDNGQWAATAVASSQYGAAATYSTTQVTGAPNVTYAGNDPASWCPATKGSGSAWLEVSFAHPVRAAGIRVRQNNAPGAIIKVEATDTAGHSHLWWQGKDPYVIPRVRDIAWFGLTVPTTDYVVASVRLTLNLAAVSDWTEIDAVQLVGGSR